MNEHAWWLLQIIYIDSPFILTSSPDVFYLNK